ncbi:MAG: hypothetical protein LUF27_06105 [Lachnospiraceae bacterium]|nr:hypothetical protein [Lachnospiraceae bacterium]
MDLFTNLFTELLSCDLSLFEELFSIVGSLYGNVILPLSVALLLMIFIWQLFKSLFGRVGLNSEDPIELTFRSATCLFMAVGAKQMVNYILRIAGTPYNWVVGTDITVASFSEYSSALELIMSALAIDSISISLITLIMQFVVAWNYFKMLLTVAERYVLLGVLSYTAPLAFATGGSKATNNILSSWCRLYGGQVILVILDAWCMKMFLAGYGNMTASGYGFTKFFAATMCLLGFCKIVFKLDSYMASLGVSLGRTSGGMGGMGFLMAASRLLSHFGGGSFESGGNSGGTDGGGTPGTGGGSLMPGGGGNGVSYPDAFSPIPLSAADGETGNAGETEPLVFGGSEPEPETQGSTESGLSENSESVFSYEVGQENSESVFSYGTGQEFSSRIQKAPEFSMRAKADSITINGAEVLRKNCLREVLQSWVTLIIRSGRLPQLVTPVFCVIT